MIQNATFNKLLQLSYDELNLKDTLYCLKSIDDTQQAKAILDKICDVKKVLDTLKVSPSQTSVDVVLNYSRHSREMKPLV